MASEPPALSIAQSMQAAWAQLRAGRLPEAERICQSVLAAEPEQPDALNLLGVLANQSGQRERALELLGRALRGQPSNAGFLTNLGLVHYSAQRPAAALACYDQALAIQPDHAGALVSRGKALLLLGRHEEAIEGLRRALALRPDFPEARRQLAIALNDHGTRLKDRNRFGEAIARYREALALEPELAEVHYNLGVALKAQGKRAQAIASYEQAIALKPAFAEARWAKAVSLIPIVHGQSGPGDDAEFRPAFARALEELDAWFAGERVREGYRAVGSQQPFHLAYEEEDNRPLLARYGALCSRLMEDWLHRQALAPLPPAPPPRGPLRLAIVSGHFYDHSVWHALLEGWLQNLDRGRVELHLFYLGTVEDGKTAIARRQAASFQPLGGELRACVEAIRARRPEAILYPEIGMDAMTTKLAALRLAPVQLATWGHPQTTGLPTIDAFLSAEGLEPEDAAAHYSERLVRLPNLGCCYPFAPVHPAPPDLGALGIDGGQPLLVCPGAPFKYVPRHDAVLVEIARRLGRCQFVFFKGNLEEQSELLQRRLQSAFAQAGLRCEDFFAWIPWQPKPAFHGLMQRADVFLDTLGFSGFNTAMQAVECGLPIATREGKFMRGRLASGILKRMQLEELVAPTDDAYVALAVRLAQDADYRQRMRERIRQSRAILFDDPAPVRALEDFLLNVSNAAGRA
jgi:predicted O-linked N-acetylglucosamine transferase (SPINDLY family)